MLSHTEIVKHCRNSECIIVRNFDTNKMEIVPIQCDGEETAQQNLFKDSLKAVRMSITLGPVVKKQKPTFKSNHQFKNYRNIIDLRKSDEQFVLGPRETVSVLSNEYIRFDGSLSALIIPRLTLADVGIALVPTYIDPHWDGILQMTLVNHTSSAFTLKLGESIAQCFFFKVDGEVDTKHEKSFPRNSHHFGQTWKKILDADAEPFPRKKRINELDYFKKILYFFSRRKNIVSSIFTSGLVISAIFGAGKLYTTTYNIDKKYQDLVALEKDVEKIKTDQTESQKKNLIKGSVSLKIKASRNSVSKTIPVSIKIFGKPMIFPHVVSDTKLSVFKVDIGKIEENIVKEIIVTIKTTKKVKKETRIDVNWILVP